MQILVNSNNSVKVNERTIAWVKDEVKSRLDRFAGKLTRVEVHLSDVNGDKVQQGDKQCTVEARFEGMQPLNVSHKADTIEQALIGSIDKMQKVLSRTTEKLGHKKGRTPFGGEPFTAFKNDADEEEGELNENE